MGAPALASLWRKWRAALWSRHSVLGILALALRGPGSGAPEPFTLSERCLCLGMGLGCTWLSVQMKHSVREATDFPEGWDNHIDSALCGGLGALLNLMIGKSLVKMVLKKDWDQRGGLRSAVSTAASCWAAALSVLTLAHAVSVATRDGDCAVCEKLFCKWRHSVAMHMLVMEPAVVAVAVLLLSARQGLSQKCRRRRPGGLQETLLTNEA
mmetsp:Transcript_63278/g.164434  ORF Transcript_63278/g.164434 Transcript_63278/m.164434 type:complete len:211 (-) Transcript_63278:54-686(-)